MSVNCLWIETTARFPAKFDKTIELTYVLMHLHLRFLFCESNFGCINHNVEVFVVVFRWSSSSWLLRLFRPRLLLLLRLPASFSSSSSSYRFFVFFCFFFLFVVVVVFSFFIIFFCYCCYFCLCFCLYLLLFRIIFFCLNLSISISTSIFRYFLRFSLCVFHNFKLDFLSNTRGVACILFSFPNWLEVKRNVYSNLLLIISARKWALRKNISWLIKPSIIITRP